ncbi:MAG: hypothetical protein COV75_05425 [Candidatus Omnitrophica bacterium CG11_big_fil_rev_8_21_14_0_20_63_9]|nr:MAG: hypothetical protein COV75_05425 [Candidatus Omnitrophica bacterium CG11_big_fil_rev_8_21_14_0_20_63_9]
MDSAERPYRRKQFLVDRQYQLRFVTRIFMVVLGVAVISSLIATALIMGSLSDPNLPQHTFIYCLITIAVTLLTELLIAIPIVLILGIRQSHRIVGPMSRIKRTLEAIGSGDYSQRIVLRQGDALEDLAKAINQMCEQLQQRRGSS